MQFPFTFYSMFYFFSYVLIKVYVFHLVNSIPEYYINCLGSEIDLSYNIF